VSIGLYLLFLVCLALACIKAITRPGLAMAIVFCLWPIKQALQARISLFANNSALANFLLAGVAGMCWLVMVLRRRRLKQRPNRVLVLSIIFVLLTFASILWSPYDHFYAIAGWKAIGSYVVLLIFFLPELFTDMEMLEDLWTSFLWVGGITAVALLFCVEWSGRAVVFPDSPLQWNPGYGKLLPTFGNPLEVGSLGLRLALIVLLARGMRFGKGLSLARWGILLLAVALMLRSGTRATIADFAICALIFFPLVTRDSTSSRSKATGIVSIVLLALIALWVQSWVSTEGRWSSDALARDTDVRTAEIANSYSAWTESGISRFLFGFGYDASFLPQLNIGWPEVSVAALVVDVGLIGLILWIWILGCGFWSWVCCFRLVRGNERDRASIVLIGAFALTDLLLSLKGSRYFYIVGWCVLIARCERYLRTTYHAASEGGERTALDPPELIGASNFSA